MNTTHRVMVLPQSSGAAGPSASQQGLTSSAMPPPPAQGGGYFQTQALPPQRIGKAAASQFGDKNIPGSQMPSSMRRVARTTRASTIGMGTFASITGLAGMGTRGVPPAPSTSAGAGIPTQRIEEREPSMPAAPTANFEGMGLHTPERIGMAPGALGAFAAEPERGVPGVPPPPSGGTATLAAESARGIPGTPPPPVAGSDNPIASTAASATGMPSIPPEPASPRTMSTNADKANLTETACSDCEEKRTLTPAIRVGVPGTPPSPTTVQRPQQGAMQAQVAGRPNAPHFEPIGQPDEQALPAGAAAVGLGPYTYAGSTANFDVYYDNGLGGPGGNMANAVLANCENDFTQMQGWFSGVPTGRFSVYIDPGTFGAYHANCFATEIHVAAFSATDGDLVNMLNMAEVDEVLMANQGVGWNCGYSNGEGLSRVLATQLYPGSLNGFASASTWLNTPGRPDYVNVTDPTDRSYVSIGCATLFLNFLRHQLRFSWQQIVRAGASTLAQTYTNLTGRTDGFARFTALLQANFPEGTAVSLSSDNVFPLPGVMGVFARGSDGAVWVQSQTAPNNGWGGWYSLGGWVDLIEVAQNDDTRLEVFARGGDGALWHNWQNSPGGAWSGWYSLGGWIDRLEVGRNADGRLEVFARGGDGALWHQWQTAPNSGWSGWYSMGGWIDMIEVGQNDDGRLEVFARGGDGAVWHQWQVAPNSGWSGWYSIGGWVDIIECGNNADGRLELFVRGRDGAVWHNWQTAPNNGWSGWYSMGGWVDMIDVGQNDDGRLEVFARGGDGAVWHQWQVAPNSGWSGWYSLGGWVDLLEVGHNADNRMEIFARGGDDAVWHNWQTAPNNGWSGWYSMGGSIDILEVWPELPGA